MLTDRVLAPFAWIVTCDELDADMRFGLLRIVIRRKRQDGRGSEMDKGDAVCFGTIVRNLAEFVSQLLIEGCLLGGKKGIQRLARRLRNCAFHRRILPRSAKPDIALAAAVNCVYCLENGDMDNRHRPACADRP